MAKNPRAVILYLVLVFGSGTLVGAAASRLYMTTSVTASVSPAKTPAQARKDFLDRVRKRVGTSEDQIVRINAALDDAKRKYSELELQSKPLRDKIDADRVASVLAVLNPSQQKTYIAWRSEVKAEREKKAAQEKAQQEKAEKEQNAATQTR